MAMTDLSSTSNLGSGDADSETSDDEELENEFTGETSDSPSPTAAGSRQRAPGEPSPDATEAAETTEDKDVSRVQDTGETTTSPTPAAGDNPLQQPEPAPVTGDDPSGGTPASGEQTQSQPEEGLDKTDPGKVDAPSGTAPDSSTESKPDAPENIGRTGTGEPAVQNPPQGTSPGDPPKDKPQDNINNDQTSGGTGIGPNETVDDVNNGPNRPDPVDTTSGEESSGVSGGGQPVTEQLDFDSSAQEGVVDAAIKEFGAQDFEYAEVDGATIVKFTQKGETRFVPISTGAEKLDEDLRRSLGRAFVDANFDDATATDLDYGEDFVFKPFRDEGFRYTEQGKKEVIAQQYDEKFQGVNIDERDIGAVTETEDGGFTAGLKESEAARVQEERLQQELGVGEDDLEVTESGEVKPLTDAGAKALAAYSADKRTVDEGDVTVKEVVPGVFRADEQANRNDIEVVGGDSSVTAATPAGRNLLEDLEDYEEVQRNIQEAAVEEEFMERANAQTENIEAGQDDVLTGNLGDTREILAEQTESTTFAPGVAKNDNPTTQQPTTLRSTGRVTAGEAAADTGEQKSAYQQVAGVGDLLAGGMDEAVPKIKSSALDLDAGGVGDAAAGDFDEVVPGVLSESESVARDVLRNTPVVVNNLRQFDFAGAGDAVAGDFDESAGRNIDDYDAAFDILGGDFDDAVGRSTDAAFRLDIAGVTDALAGSTDEAVGRGSTNLLEGDIDAAGDNFAGEVDDTTAEAVAGADDFFDAAAGRSDEAIGGVVHNTGRGDLEAAADNLGGPLDEQVPGVLRAQRRAYRAARRGDVAGTFDESIGQIDESFDTVARAFTGTETAVQFQDVLLDESFGSVDEEFEDGFQADVVTEATSAGGLLTEQQEATLAAAGERFSQDTKATAALVESGIRAVDSNSYAAPFLGAATRGVSELGNLPRFATLGETGVELAGSINDNTSSALLQSGTARVGQLPEQLYGGATEQPLTFFGTLAGGAVVGGASAVGFSRYAPAAVKTGRVGRTLAAIDIDPGRRAAANVRGAAGRLRRRLKFKEFLEDRRGSQRLTGPNGRPDSGDSSTSSTEDVTTITAEDLLTREAVADISRGGRFGDSGPARGGDKEITERANAEVRRERERSSSGGEVTGLGYRTADSEADTDSAAEAAEEASNVVRETSVGGGLDGLLSGATSTGGIAALQSASSRRVSESDAAVRQARQLETPGQKSSTSQFVGIGGTFDLDGDREQFGLSSVQSAEIDTGEVQGLRTFQALQERQRNVPVVGEEPALAVLSRNESDTDTEPQFGVRPNDRPRRDVSTRSDADARPETKPEQTPILGVATSPTLRLTQRLTPDPDPDPDQDADPDPDPDPEFFPNPDDDDEEFGIPLAGSTRTGEIRTSFLDPLTGERTPSSDRGDGEEDEESSSDGERIDLLF